MPKLRSRRLLKCLIDLEQVGSTGSVGQGLSIASKSAIDSIWCQDEA